MEREDLRVMSSQTESADGRQKRRIFIPVSDADLASLGYHRAEDVKGVELDGPAVEWLSIPVAGLPLDVDVAALRDIRETLSWRSDGEARILVALLDQLLPPEPADV